MMAMSRGFERTESQWHRLLESVGFRVGQIWRLYDETEAVIEAVLA